MSQPTRRTWAWWAKLATALGGIIVSLWQSNVGASRDAAAWFLIGVLVTLVWFHTQDDRICSDRREADQYAHFKATLAEHLDAEAPRLAREYWRPKPVAKVIPAEAEEVRS